MVQQSILMHKVINSPGSFTISKLERINGGWRCYFTRQDGEGRMVSNTMGMDDYAYCETFNLVSEQGAIANHYYHRCVFGLGTDYVDICDNTNAEDYASGSDEPRIGDEVSTLGNKTNPARQHAIIQSAAGTGSPYYRMYVGINSFSLPKPKIQMSPTEGSWWMVTDENGRELTIEQYLSSLRSQLTAVQQQADKQIVIWFGDAVPTLNNEPAGVWLDDLTRSEHLHDVYYNRSYAHTGGGRAYSFERSADGNSYIWAEITDADVLTSLEAANRAQDTADGKRRVFVAQPTREQACDVGDLWVNATFSSHTIEYDNDVLRAVSAKAIGDEFSIVHWKPVQTYTTKPVSEVIQLADKAVKVIAGNGSTLAKLTEAIGKGDEASLYTMQGRFNAVISSLSGTSDLVHAARWDDEGNLLGFRNVGMLRSVAGEDGSLTLFSDYYDAAGTKKHSASFRLTTNSDGSSLLFDADQINFLGKTVINGKFIVDKSGNVTMNNFTANDANITGNVIARTGRIGGFTIEDGTLLWQQADYFGHKSRGLHLGVSQESDSAVVDVFFNAATKGTFGVRAIGGNAGGAAIFGSQYTTGEEQYTKPKMDEYYAGFFCGNVCCTDSVSARKFFVIEKDYAAAGAKGWEGIDFDYNIDLDHYRLQVRGGIIVGLKHE